MNIDRRCICVEPSISYPENNYIRYIILDCMELYNRISTIRKHKARPKKTCRNPKIYNGGKYNGGKYIGGKWSKKYKLSINCNKPKGFSQRQYCKYANK